MFKKKMFIKEIVLKIKLEHERYAICEQPLYFYLLLLITFIYIFLGGGMGA